MNINKENLDNYFNKLCSKHKKKENSQINYLIKYINENNIENDLNTLCAWCNDNKLTQKGDELCLRSDMKYNTENSTTLLKYRIENSNFQSILSIEYLHSENMQVGFLVGGADSETTIYNTKKWKINYTCNENIKGPHISKIFIMRENTSGTLEEIFKELEYFFVNSALLFKTF